MNSSSHISRRQLSKGIAWSVPVIAATAVAPAYAASPVYEGLGGLVTVTGTCDNSGSVRRFTINGIGSYPTRGLWVENAVASTTIQDTMITFYYPTSHGVLSWVRQSASSGWSTPTRDTSVEQISGYYAYTTRYSGSWTYDSTNSLMIANGQPYFIATVSDSTCRNFAATSVYSRRSVNIDGRNYLLKRGPVSLRG